MKQTLPILLFFMICLISGCTNELYENTDNTSMEGNPVTFSVQSAATSGSSKTFISEKLILSGCDTLSPRFSTAETKSPSVSPIPIGTTIRIVAYKRNPINTTPDTSTDIFVASQSYELSKSNTLIPVNVNAEGNIIPGSASEMYLSDGEYDFYAYSPAIPMVNDSIVAIPQGTDYTTTSLYSNIINIETNTISLPNFERKMAQLELIIEADPSAIEINSIKLSDNGIVLILPGTTTMNAKIGGNLNSQGPGSYYFIPTDNCKEVSATQIICTACLYPMSKSSVGIEMNLEVNGVTKLHNAIINPTTFTEGNKYIYQINITRSDIDIKPTSNSYMVQPGETIIFPINQVETTGSFNTNTQIWKASVYWQTSSQLIDIVTEDQKNDLLQIKSNGQGNALVIVTPANSNTILWSWHIWCTNYVPDEGLSASTTSSVPGGRVIRLKSSPFASKKIVMMDRNMGALSAFHNQSSWGMYYQWGRKDPFPPPTQKVYGHQTSYSLAYLASYYKSIKNPTKFYYGYFNWLLMGSNYLWSDTEKSIFDPCPPGWRVPTSSDYNVKMATTIQWKNSPGIYNDGAIYTPQNVWYPAQGAIDYFTGITKWEGKYAYLWTSTNGFFDYSNTLTISSHFNSAGNDEERAYGIPVRCIQD